jgi:hypothetical protein
VSLSNRFISLILMPLAVAFNSAEGAPQKQGNKKSLDIPAPVIVSPRGSLLGNLNFSKTLPGPSATLLVKDPNSLKIHNFNCASLNRASTDLLMGIDSKNAVPFTNPEQIKDAKGRLGCKSYDI